MDGPALEVLHDDVRPVVVLADVEHGDDVRMRRKARGGVSLTREAGSNLGASRVALREDLESDRSLEAGRRRDTRRPSRRLR